MEAAASVDPMDRQSIQSPKANLLPRASDNHPKKRDPKSIPDMYTVELIVRIYPF